MPVTKFDQTYKFLFGIVSIRVLIEDRRPDLEEYHSKYKNFLWVKVFGRVVFHRLLHSSRLGYIFMNDGKEININ